MVWVKIKVHHEKVVSVTGACTDSLMEMYDKGEYNKDHEVWNPRNNYDNWNELNR